MTARCELRAALLLLAGVVGCNEITSTPLPGAPESVTATLLDRRTVRIGWNERPRAEHIVSYGVYRDGRQIGETAGTSYEDTTAPELVMHAYAVASRSSDGIISELSATASIFTPDATPPRVITTIPSNGAINIEPRPTLSVIFSEPLDPASVASSITVRTATGSVVPGTISYTSPSNTVRWEAGSGIAADERVTITIATSVRDTASNAIVQPYSFEFRVRELTPPVLLSISPVNNASNVSLYTRPTFTFSERMQRVCCFGMREAGTNTGVSAIPSLDSTGRILSVTPYGRFKPNTTYTLNLDRPPLDAVGNPMEGTIELTFTYGNDFHMPRLVSTAPATGATGVSTSHPTFTLTFDEPLLSTSGYQNVFELKTAGGATVDGGFFLFPVYDTKMTYTAPLLQPNTAYVLTYTHGYNAGGLVLPSETVSISFTTGT